MERAQEARLVGRRRRALDRARHAGLHERQGAGLRSAARSHRRRRAPRRCPVHHARRRAGLDLGAARPRGRPAAGALRAVRVAGQQSAVSPAGESIRGSEGTRRQRLCPVAWRSQLSTRPDDLPADGTSHRRRHVTHAVAPRRAPARALLRDLTRSGARGRGRERRVGPRVHGARHHRGARARHATAPAAHRAGAPRPPGRPALSFRRTGPRARRRRQRPRRHLAGTERQDHGSQRTTL